MSRRRVSESASAFIRPRTTRTRLLFFLLLFLSLALVVAHRPADGKAQTAQAQPSSRARVRDEEVVPGRWLGQAPRAQATTAANEENPEEANAAEATVAVAEADGETVAGAPQTITWTAADNPHVVSGTYVVPSDTTLIWEPGVVVQINSNSTLRIEGRVLGQGSADRRIRVEGADNYSAIVAVPGTIELSYTDLFVKTEPQSGGNLLYTNCKWGVKGFFYSPGDYNFQMPSYMQFEHCTFENGAAIWASTSNIRLKDVAFLDGSYAWILYSYVYLDDVRSENNNSGNAALMFNVAGPLYLDNIQVRNSTGAAFKLGGDNFGGNYFLGPNNTIAGNQYPVKLDSGGILPGSTVPSTGNANNYVLAEAENGQVDWRGPMVWSPLSVPYVVLSPLNLYGGGNWTILPGTTVKFGANFSGITDETLGLVVRGRPHAPVRFERFDPSQPWGGIGNTRSGNRYAHVILEGSTSGISSAPNSGAFAYVEDFIIRNNQTGSHGGVIVQGTRYFDNQIAYDDTGGLTAIRGVLNGTPASPNSFERNTIAVRSSSSSTIRARNNWWNSPTGPTTPNNPGGTGDPVQGAVEFIPYLTVRPDYSDQPPVVRQREPFFTYNPGEKVTLTWEAEDDHGLVEHRILFNPAGNHFSQFQTVIDHLPAATRSYEWTVPSVGFQSTYSYGTVRVVSVDTAGHERFDDQSIQIPSGEVGGDLTFTSNLAGATFRPGQRTRINWTAINYTVSDFNMYVVLDDRYFISQGGAFLNYGGWDAKIPYVSTDTARIAIKVYASSNRVKWFFSPYFKIRPDERIGDTPPTVTLQTPASGASYYAGDVVPLSWTAADDEEVRSFNIQVSYDGGRSWNVLAEDLPGTTTSYNFQTANGAGYGDVRFRVTAVDRRFQKSSAGADRSISLRATPAPNISPAVTLIHPTTGSSYLLSTNLTLRAEASDNDGTIARVEFYDGTTLVGTDTSAPYEISWSNAAAGHHSLSARAFDEREGTGTSNTAEVTLYSSPPPPTQRPGTLWAATCDGTSSGNDELPEMVMDAQRNLFVVGQSRGIGTERDIVAVKYNTNGQQLWVARYNGTGNGNDYAYDLDLDPQGNLYITGTTWRRYNFDGGTEFDYVTLKYSPGGNLLWTRFYAGSALNDIPRDMKVDTMGNVYVTGGSVYSGIYNFAVNRIATIKYDTHGNEQWVRTYDSEDRWGATGNGVDVDSAGNVYVTGDVKDATVNANTTDDNIITLKYNAGGVLQWAVQYDTPTQDLSDFDRAEFLHVDEQGSLYVLGAGKPSGDYDVLILKYNAANGALITPRYWAGAGVEDPNGWAFDNAGNIYIAGRTESLDDYGSFFTLKFDAALVKRWDRLYNGPTGDGFDTAFSITTDAYAGVYVVGPSLGVDGDYDFLLLKYLSDGTLSVVQRHEGPEGLDDNPQTVLLDGEGNIYITGDTRRANGYLDFLTLKLPPVLEEDIYTMPEPPPIEINGGPPTPGPAPERRPCCR